MGYDNEHRPQLSLSLRGFFRGDNLRSSRPTVRATLSFHVDDITTNPILRNE